MPDSTIDYTLTDSDRRGLSVSFGIDLAKVPTRVTGGEPDASGRGVTFRETIGGHRIALWSAGRPPLERALAGRGTPRPRKVA